MQRTSNTLTTPYMRAGGSQMMIHSPRLVRSPRKGRIWKVNYKDCPHQQPCSLLLLIKFNRPTSLDSTTDLVGVSVVLIMGHVSRCS